MLGLFYFGDVIDWRRLGRLGPVGIRGLLIVLKDFVGDIAAHFGIHCHLGEIFLQFLIHRRIYLR